MPRVALGRNPVLTMTAIFEMPIASETLARTLEIGSAVPGAEQQQAVDVDGHQVTFSMRRHGA